MRIKIVFKGKLNHKEKSFIESMSHFIKQQQDWNLIPKGHLKTKFKDKNSINLCVGISSNFASFEWVYIVK